MRQKLSDSTPYAFYSSLSRSMQATCKVQIFFFLPFPLTLVENRFYSRAENATERIFLTAEAFSSTLFREGNS